ncbi:MAG: hypothetical protein J7M25_12075 [Deltaproteobacteria bacterium]|nr:hypothetical protein [Deltaproteobacteria bacterium]
MNRVIRTRGVDTTETRKSGFLVGLLVVLLQACAPQSREPAAPHATQVESERAPVQAIGRPVSATRDKNDVLPKQGRSEARTVVGSTARSIARPGRTGHGPSFSTKAERLDIFNALVGQVRAIHVFSRQTAKNLGHDWDADLPRLRRLFASADSRQRFIEALWMFANSLHNPHCTYEPTGRVKRLSPGFSLDVEWTGGRAQFYVDRVTDDRLKTQLHGGDILVSLDGAKAADLLRHYALWSNRNNWFGISRDLARTFSNRPVVGAAPAPSTWVFRRRQGGKLIRLVQPWKEPAVRSDDYWSEVAIDYDHLKCPGGPRHYGPYRLTAVGVNFCLYTSNRRPERFYPIVRQHVFYYDYRASWAPGAWRAVRRFVAADYDHLARIFRTIGPVRGVLLDLRGNHGGNNPNWFLDWWAPRAYRDQFVSLRLHPKIAAKMSLVLKYSKNRTQLAVARAYLDSFAKLPKGSGPAMSAKMPFACKSDGCNWSNRYVPKHRLTRAPVALLVGPGCVSSCDHVAQVFADYGFGPLVGEPTAAGFTMMRHQVNLSLGPKRPLGALRLCASFGYSGRTGRPVEAVPLHLTKRINRTFANRKRYDRILVDAAIGALREGRWPRSPRR